MNAQTENKGLITAISFDELRLPYVTYIADAFGIDNVRWKVLIDTIFPSARSTEAVVMALTYCKARGLDIFKHPVHVVPMWSSVLGKEVETVWPGVSELRTTAFRTKQYAGCDAAEFGPSKTQTFKGKVRGKGKNAPDENMSIEVTFPEWCQITVHRLIGGQIVRFASPKVYWLEAYARRGRADIPNDMWCKRPFGQIEKCAEAAALRRAFPEEIGNELTAEEMEGQITTTGVPIETKPPIVIPPTPPAPPPSPVSAVRKQLEASVAQIEAEKQGFDFDAYRAALQSVQSNEEADGVWRQFVENAAAITDEETEEAQRILNESTAKFWKEEA